MRKAALVMVMIGVSSPAFAVELILPTIQVQAQNAVQQKAILDQQLKDAQAKVTQRAAELAGQVNNTAALAGSTAANAVQSAPQTAAQLANTVVDSKEAVFEDVVCRVINSDTREELSATSHLSPNWQSSLRLASILSKQVNGENLEVTFKASPDGKAAIVQLIDAGTSDQSLRRKVSLEDLHLETDCTKKRRIDALAESLGKIVVDSVVKAAAQAVEQKADQEADQQDSNSSAAAAH